MYYGLHFISDAKIPMQVRVHSATLRIYCRAAPNGEWGAWRRLDVDRNADGSLKETVASSNHAKSADAATRFKLPMKITFNGGVSGSVSFDGSEDVSCALSANVDGDIEAAVAKAMQEHLRLCHSSSSDNTRG